MGQGHIISCPYTPPYDIFFSILPPNKKLLFLVGNPETEKGFVVSSELFFVWGFAFGSRPPLPSKAQHRGTVDPSQPQAPHRPVASHWVPSHPYHCVLFPGKHKKADGNSSLSPRACLYQGSLHQPRDPLIAEAVQVKFVLVTVLMSHNQPQDPCSDATSVALTGKGRGMPSAMLKSL